MSLREFYKSQYALEGARKTDLTSAVALPVGVLSVLVGALVVMAKELHIPLPFGAQVQLAAVMLSAIACAFSGYHLFRSLFNYEYAYAPTPEELKKYNEQLIAFHQANGHSMVEARALAESETLNYIDNEYAKDASRNSANNDVKSTYLHRAFGAIMAAVLTASVAGVAYVFNSVSSSQPVQKIEIVNLKEVPTMTSTAPIQAATTPQPPPPAQPIRPEPPPSRMIKEDKRPPKPPPSNK